MKSKIHELIKANYFSVSKKILLTVLVMAGISATAQVKVGTNPTVVNASAILEMESTNKGLLLPRMTTVQRTAIATPAAGLQVYDTDTDTVWFHNGTVWVNSTPAGGTSKWTNDLPNTRVFLTNQSNGTTARTAGTEFMVADNGNVGIGSANSAAAKVFITETALNATKTGGLSSFFKPESVALSANLSGTSTTLETDAADATNKGILLGNHTSSFHRGTGSVAEFRALSGAAWNQGTGAITSGQGANVTVSNRSTGTIGTATGVLTAVDHASTGAMTSARGFATTISNNAGTMTNVAGLNAFIGSGSGTMTDVKSLQTTIHHQGATVMASANGFDSNISNRSTGTISIIRAISNTVNNAAASTGTITDVRSIENNVNTGATGFIPSARNTINTISNSGTGTMILARNVDNNIFNTSTGIITSAIGSNYNINSLAAGTITNAIAVNVGFVKGENASGLVINNISGGTSATLIRLGSNISGTTQYGIFSETSAPSYFAGRFGIGPTSSTPISLLDVGDATGLAVTGNNDGSTNWTPFMAKNRMILSWNQSAGSGEYDFINTFAPAGAFPKGFMWHNLNDVAGVGTPVRLMNLSEPTANVSGGRLTVNEYHSVDATATLPFGYGINRGTAFDVTDVTTFKVRANGLNFSDNSKTHLSGNQGINFYTNNTNRMAINATGNVGIGTLAPSASAALDVSSTTAGFLLPRMTTVQRNAIATPATGLMVYNTNTTGLEYFDGVNWNSVSSNSSSSISTKTANYTFGIDDKTILMNCTAGALTVTLPAVATNTGRTIVVSKIDTTANALTFSSAVRTNLSTTLASVNFSTSLTLQSDGTNWWVIARN